MMRTRPRGYFHEDECIDQLYRIVEIQGATIGRLFALCTITLPIAMAAFVLAVKP